jgi:hypothetical protein
MNKIPNIKTSIDDEALASETYERILPELQALKTEELILINRDIPTVVTTTLGALPEIKALRPEIVEQLPRFDITSFNKLEDYAFTLNYTHGQYITATQPSDDLEVLVAEATTLRETLLTDASALARRGLVDGNRLQELKGVNGFKNLATDLGALANILRESWPSIQTRTNIQLSELEQAGKMAHRILRIVGLREQGPVMVAAATDMRTRAFTLLARTYDDARRAVIYLRANEGDADKIAPSLYGGRKRKGAEAASPVEPAPAPTPAPAPAATGAQPAAHPAHNSTDPFVS